MQQKPKRKTFAQCIFLFIKPGIYLTCNFIPVATDSVCYTSRNYSSLKLLAPSRDKALAAHVCSSFLSHSTPPDFPPFFKTCSFLQVTSLQDICETSHSSMWSHKRLCTTLYSPRPVNRLSCRNSVGGNCLKHISGLKSKYRRRPPWRSIYSICRK